MFDTEIDQLEPTLNFAERQNHPLTSPKYGGATLNSEPKLNPTAKQTESDLD